jgi:hypothetical protein
MEWGKNICLKKNLQSQITSNFNFLKKNLIRVGHNHKLGLHRNKKFLWMQIHIHTHLGPFLAPFPKFLRPSNAFLEIGLVKFD